MTQQTLRTLLLALIGTFFSLSAYANGGLRAVWSHAGPSWGEYGHCINITEPGDPMNHVWADNYLCFNRPDHGFAYSYAGPIPGMSCTSFNLKGGPWADNYICSRRFGFAWFPRNIQGGYRCIRVLEAGDPDPRAKGTQGYSNHFCIKK